MNVERGEVGATGVPCLASPGGSHVGTALLTRSVWIILAVIVLWLNLLGIPYAYERYATICTRAAQVCSQNGLLTPEAAQELRQRGVSVEVYAAYNGVAIPIATTLVFVAVAVVLYQAVMLVRPD